MPDNVVSAEVEGVASRSIGVGEMIFYNLLVDEVEYFDPEVDHRLVAVPVDLEKDGIVTAGDRVDLLWFHRGDNITKSETILRNVRVHKVYTSQGTTTEDAEDSALIGSGKTLPGVITVYATSEEANVINLAKNTGALSVSLYLHDSQPTNATTAILRGGGITTNSGNVSAINTPSSPAPPAPEMPTAPETVTE